MPKYLGYATQLGLDDKWYGPGEDIPSIDADFQKLLVRMGHTFDPMPDVAPLVTFEDPGSGPAEMPQLQGQSEEAPAETPAQTPPAQPPQGGQQPAQQPA